MFKFLFLLVCSAIITLFMESFYKCVQLNCDNSAAATSLLGKFLISSKSHICFVQDIYCTKKGEVYSPPTFPGFKVFVAAKRSEIPKVALYISDNIKGTLISQASNSHCIVFKLSSENSVPNSEYILSSIYSPPSDSSPSLKLQVLLSNLSSNELSNLIMCGDFNSHSSTWATLSNTDSKGEELEEIFLQNNLCVVNEPDSPPTFISSRGRSWIDLTVCGGNVVDKISSWNVLGEETLSFHQMITFNFHTRLDHATRVKYHFSTTNWENFNKALLSSFEEIGLDSEFEVESKQELDELVTAVTDIFTKTIQSEIPKSSNYKKRNLVPWWSKEIRTLRKEVNKARKKHQLSKNITDLQNYRKLRSCLKNLIRDSKRNSFRKFCSTTNNPWDLIRKLTSSYKLPCVPTLKKEDGTYTSSDVETCEFLLNQWFPDDNINHESEEHSSIRKEVDEYLQNHAESPLPPITDHEMDVVDSISPLKASGKDLVKAIILQNLSAEVRVIIKKIFNSCLKLGLFPTAWKIGAGTILPKPDRLDIENYKAYRCITLLSVLGKWFEKILQKRLLWETSVTQSISKHQYGFLPGKSCEEAVSEIVYLIEKAFNENKFVLIIFLDIAGAFDCTWHPSMIKSLIDKGIDKGYINIIQDYLSKRLIQLKINNSKAEKCLTRSAPQGGGLSPFLWNCDFDDMLGHYSVDPEAFATLAEHFDVENNVQAFADDSQAIFIGESLFQCQQAANNVLAKMVSKSKIKKMSYNAPKSNAVVFSKKPIPFNVKIKLGDEIVKVSTSSKVVGVTLDSKLNWHEHIENQVTKCKRLIFHLCRCCKLKWGLETHVLVKIWLGCIEPVLLYGCVVWVTILKSDYYVRKIESVQRLFAIKLIRGFKSISYEASLTLSGLPPIINRIHERVLSYAAKHPDHYSQPCLNSHIDFTNDLSSTYNIDIGKYGRNVVGLNSTPPYMRCSPNVSISPLSLYPLAKEGTLNIYTDGSKTPDGTGCAFVVFYPDWIDYGQFKLSNENSVFQAELLAIRNCLQSLFNCQLGSVFHKINIFSDSVSSLQSIKDCDPKNSLARDVQKYISFFSMFTEVTLTWCKGHSEILGNELADFFAKDAINNPHSKFVSLPPSLSHLKNTVKSKSELDWLTRWKSSTNGKHTRMFIPNLTPSHLKNRFGYKMTQTITGHSRLNFYLSSIGKSVNPVCACEKFIETVSHYLFRCEIESENRADTLIKSCFQEGIQFPPKPELLISNKTLFKSLQTFLNRSSRLDF